MYNFENISCQKLYTTDSNEKILNLHPEMNLKRKLNKKLDCENENVASPKKKVLTKKL